MPENDIDFRKFIKRGEPRIRPDIPDDIFFYAVETVLAEKRLDLTRMAQDLGVSRMTVHRKIKRRDDLLGAAMLYISQFMLQTVMEAGENKVGVERIGAITRRLFELVSLNKPLRFLLTNEPECALRLLTTKQGPVQAQFILFVEALLDIEIKEGHLHPTMDLHTLAYLLVRIGESFMYSDAIADQPVDIDQAHKCIVDVLRTQVVV